MTVNKELAEKFRYLKENYSPARAIEYAEYIRSLTVEAVLENAEVVFVEPLKGADVLYEILKENIEKIPISLLESVYNFKLLPYYSNARKGGYENKEHIDKIIKCMRLIEGALEAFDFKKDTIKILQEEMNNLNIYGEEIVTEGVVSKFIELNNEFFSYFQKLGAIQGSILGVKLIKKKYKLNDEKEAIQLYIKELENQKKMLEKKLEKYEKGEVDLKGKAADTSLYGIFPKDQIKMYIKNFDTAIEFQKKRLNALQSVKEGIMSMQPDLATDYDESHVELLKKKLECKFAIDFVETFMDENEDINMESFNRMLRTAYLYDLVCEGNEEYVHEGVITNSARKVAVKGDELARKTVHGIRKVGSNTKRVKVVAKRIPQHFDNLINSTLGRIAKMDKNERRKRIIEGGYKLKLFKLIRNGILIGASWAVSPALAAIGILTSLLLDGRLDDKVRTEVLEELNSELRIVREKIKDADRKGDDKKKYQLMRIEDKLEKDIHRIQMRADKIIVSRRGVRI